MKLTLSVALSIGHLQIEADSVDALAKAHVQVVALQAGGYLPATHSSYDSAPPMQAEELRDDVVPTEGGADLSEATSPEPAPPATTRKPRATKAKAEEPKPEPPAETAAPEPKVEARPVTRADATDAMRKLGDEHGTPALKQVLTKLGVERFGLFVAEEGAYGPVVDAVNEVKAALAKGGEA